MRTLRAGFFISLILGAVAAVIAVSDVLVFSGFGCIPFALVMLSIVMGAGWACAKVGRVAGRVAIVAGALLAGLLVLVVSMIAFFATAREGRAEYTSPSGESTVIIEYDLASRPFLYRREGMRKVRIPFHFGPGYNETVRLQVEWLSDTELRLTDPFGESWDIDIEQ